MVTGSVSLDCINSFCYESYTNSTMLLITEMWLSKLTNLHIMAYDDNICLVCYVVVEYV